MLIRLDQIKIADNELRSDYDRERLQDLQWSLMEQGQVEPIGVCKNEDGYYTIVWGHRRYKAATLAGWENIEAVIVANDKAQNLIQAGIENLAKEEMSIQDKADWAYRLNKEIGLSLREISRRSAIPHNTISQWLTWRKEVKAGVVTGDQSNGETMRTIVNVAGVLGDDLEAKKTVIESVNKRNLNRDQAKEIAKAYKAADTPDLKEAVLKTPVKAASDHETILTEARFKKAVQDRYPETFVFTPDWERELMRDEETHPYICKLYRSINSTRRHILLGPLFAEQELFTPDQAAMTIDKLDEFITEIEKYKQALKAA